METMDLLIELERFISIEGLSHDDSINALVEKLNEVAMEEVK